VRRAGKHKTLYVIMRKIDGRGDAVTIMTARPSSGRLQGKLRRTSNERCVVAMSQSIRYMIRFDNLDAADAGRAVAALAARCRSSDSGAAGADRSGGVRF
jgi:hypothetical protein